MNTIKSVLEGIFYGALVVLGISFIIFGFNKIGQSIISAKIENGTTLAYLCESKSDEIAKFILECIKSDNSLNQCERIAIDLYCKRETK